MFDGRPKIPERSLSVVQNMTLFDHLACMKMAPRRRFCDTVVIKATYDLGSGELTPARLQAPVALADVFWDPDAPERSSLQHAGEVVVLKTRTDVIVTGSARPPAGKPLSSWYAAVRVEGRRGRAIDYVAQVTGKRCWQHRPVRGWVLSDPEPALEVPIRYERAYGGAYRDRSREEPAWIVHSPNPSGTGFFDEAAMDRSASYPAPQWQPCDQPISRINHPVPLTGFGPVMRAWTDRYRYAGTYDDRWTAAMRAGIEQGLPPDYPPDFDARFFSCAHPALVAPGYLAGDEEISLTGFFGDHGRLAFRLPSLVIAAMLRDARGDWSRQVLPLDTVHVDVDLRQVYLCWRLTLDHQREIEQAFIGDWRIHEQSSHRERPGGVQGDLRRA